MMQSNDLSKNSNFCFAPWIHLVITQGGDIRPCNDFQMNFGSIKNDNLESVFNNENFKKLRDDLLHGRLHPGCRGCREKERLIGYSRRISIDSQIKEWGERKEKWKLKTEVTAKNIKWLDIRLSNYCNLKCRHCYPALSTRWFEDIKGFEGVKFTKDSQRLSLEEYFHAYRKRKGENLPLKKIYEVIDAVGRPLKRIEFKGGEPFLQKELPIFLEYYLDNISPEKSSQKTTDKTRFVFVTNGTIIPPKIKELIARLGLADICYSVEGISNAYDYIRGDGKYRLKDIRKNILELDELPNVKTSFRITCMAYNIFEIPRIYSWISRLPLKRNAKNIIIENYVVRPDFLNVMVIPYDIRHRAAKGINKILKNKKKNLDASIYRFYESLNERVDGFSRKNLENFKIYTATLDKIRGTDIKEAIPQIRKLFL